MLKLTKYEGFTLVELMITLVINVVLFAALITMFIANIRHYNKTTAASQLNEQLQSAMDLMSNDIRRAGYWANARSDIGTHQNNNPFMTSSNDVTVNVANNCILFAYDHSNDGALPAISSSYDDERYGFRLINQTLQARPPGASFSCAASSTAWENITDPNFVSITQLIFSLTTTTITTGPGTRGIALRSVDITLTGQLANDSSITRTLTQQIRIRNDKFIP